jgi:N-acetylglucosamine-6-phosphate deacetylase
MILSGARVVTPRRILNPGWVEIDDRGRITYAGAGAPPSGSSDVIDLGGAWLLPGFIDLHVHGGGGSDVTKGAADMAAAVAFHRRRGTTLTLVSLMAQPVDLMCEQLNWAADLTHAGELAGVHLEGPFLSSARCGAQRPESLLMPDPLVLRKLLEAGQGSVRTVTIAPELPGALEVIAELVAGGIVAAIGHTDATFDQAAAGFAAGATLATHLFNAMGSFNQRQPGPSIAALDAGVHVEMINDGFHVHDALIRLVGRNSPRALAFITDAISATGVGDGEYTLGEQDVEVRNGAPRLAGSDSLAGSTLTMDDAVRRAVQSVGLPMEVASAAASGNPARVLGVADRTGSIAAGLDADLVVLADDLSVQRVMRRGAWVATS